jgi:hypothetical protein
MHKLLCVSVAAIALAGCSVSASLPQDISSALSNGSGPGPIVTDFTDAQYNLNQAMAVGALPANDPGAACLNQVAQQLNIGGTPAVSFVPKVGGTLVLSGASVLYIRYNQAAGLQGTFTPPQGCLALMGKMQWDTLKAALQGASLAGPALGIPSIPGLPAKASPISAPTTIAPPPLPSGGAHAQRYAPAGIVVSEAESNPSLGGK